MARQVLPIAGAVVGSYFGGPTGAQWGYAIGSLVGNAVDPQVVKGPGIGDGQQTTAQEGSPRPIVWGTACVGGNIIARGDLRKIVRRERQGKGGGPVVEEERFLLTYAVRMCEGPIDALVRVWEDEKLVYDIRSSGSQVDPAENAKFLDGVSVYYGDESQMPDPDLENIFGVGDTPAYRGTAYIVFRDQDVTDRRGSVPNYRFEVSTSSSVTEYVDLLTGLSGWTYGPATSDPVINHGPHGIPYSPTNERMSGPNVAVSPSGRLFAFTDSGSSALPFGLRVLSLNDNGTSYDQVTCVRDGTGYQGNYNIRTAQWVPNRDDTFFVTGGSGVNFYVDTYRVVGMTATRVASHQLLSGQGGTPLAGVSRDGNRVAFVRNGSPRTLRVYNYDSATGVFSSPGATASISGALNNIMKPDFMGDRIILSGRYASPPWYAIRAYVVDANNDVVFGAEHLFPGLSSGPSRISRAVFGKNNSNVYAKVGPPPYSVRRLSLVDQTGPTPPTPLVFAEIQNVSPPMGVTLTHYEYDFHSDHSRSLIFCQTETSSNAYPFFVYSISDDGTLSIAPKQTTTTSPPLGNESGALIYTGSNGSSAVTGTWRVSDVITDVADRLRIPSQLVDASELDSLELKGLVAAEQYTGANILRKLQEVYFFDPAEYDGQMFFHLRGKPVVLSIGSFDFVDESYNLKRESYIEYPRVLDLMYQNARVGYAPAKARSERISPSIEVVGSVTTDTPVVLTEDDAAQTADKLHKVAWAEAEGEVEFGLAGDYDELTTTDCIGVYTLRDDGSIMFANRYRIERIERADGVAKITAKVDRQSAYTSNVTGLQLPDPTPPPPTIPGDSILAYMDLPALIDNHDALIYYVAATGSTEAWRGAVVQRQHSTPEYNTIAQAPMGALVGTLVTALPGASAHYIDRTNVLRVKFTHEYAQPESVDTISLLQENNALAVLYPDGTGEVIQFRDVAHVGDAEYELSYLIRGRLNTSTAAHAAGAMVVMLEDSLTVSATVSMIGQTLNHRAVSTGQDPTTAPTQSDTYTAQSQTEWAPGYLRAVVDGSDIDISWLARHRFGNDIHPVQSVNFDGWLLRVTGSSATIEINIAASDPTSHTVPVSSVGAGPYTIRVAGVNRLTGVSTDYAEVVI